MQSMADGSNCLESFSDEKIPGSFQGFKNSSPTHSHEEDRIYTQIISGIYQKNKCKEKLTGQLGII